MKNVNRIDWLDYARFLSALAVVCFHYISPGISDHMPFMPDMGLVQRIANYGYLGVDFFFMVSGYVIMLSVGERSASEFAEARILRLYPAYLFCMTLTWVVLATVQNPQFPVTAWQYAVNLTMVSNVLGVPYVDSVYWTLIFEIMFYAAVYLLILLGARNRLEECAMAWLALQIMAWAIGISVPMVSGYFALFCAGCLLYFATAKGWTPVRIGAVLVSFLLNLAGIVERGALRTDLSGIELNHAALIAVMVLFFAAFVVLSRTSLRLPYAKVIGSLTYPLYLVHQYLGYLLIGALVAVVSPGLAVFLTICVMLIVALFVAEIVERKPKNIYRATIHRLAAPLRLIEGRFWRITNQGL